jgi:hypothetical protein
LFLHFVDLTSHAQGLICLNSVQTQLRQGSTNIVNIILMNGNQSNRAKHHSYFGGKYFIEFIKNTPAREYFSFIQVI